MRSGRFCGPAAAALLVVGLACGGAQADDTEFHAAAHAISPAARQAMTGVSWKPGCPVDPADLTSLELSYWGFDGAPHVGTMVVHRRLADETVAIFRELFEAKFPIEQMQPYETYPIGEYAAADDTVGFYCRPDQGDPTNFGMHSYGFAIDINPLLNPYQDRVEGWWPAGSTPNAQRDRGLPGQVTAGSVVFAAFTRHGWFWGGLSSHGPDYMHFEKGTEGGHRNPLDAPYVIDGLTYTK
jgi:D-alanyl-D-alanine carboxypeptidase